MFRVSFRRDCGDRFARPNTTLLGGCCKPLTRLRRQAKPLFERGASPVRDVIAPIRDELLGFSLLTFDTLLADRCS